MPNPKNKQIAAQMALQQSPDMLSLLQFLISGADTRFGGSPYMGLFGKAGLHDGLKGYNPFFQTMDWKAQDAGHDAAMNYTESRLQDELAQKGLTLDDLPPAEQLRRLSQLQRGRY